MIRRELKHTHWDGYYQKQKLLVWRWTFTGTHDPSPPTQEGGMNTALRVQYFKYSDIVLFFYFRFLKNKILLIMLKIYYKITSIGEDVEKLELLCTVS